MRIEYYDADTHDLVRRDAYSQALVNALRERDEARAEIERLRGELDYRNEAPDAAALRAEGTTLAKMTRDAVGDEPDAHALAVYGYVSKVDQFLTRLRAAPPSFHLTDIEAASYDVCAANYPGGIDSDRAEEVLRKHTRAVSVEEVAQAIHEEAMRGDTWERIVKGNPVALALRFSAARAALRVIGARLAENTGTGAPVSTQHPKDSHGHEKRGHIRGPDERQASDGSGDGGEGRVPRADAAGDLGGEGMQAPGCEPGEAARGPQGDGSRSALDCHRADALPGGADGGGARGDAPGILLMDDGDPIRCATFGGASIPPEIRARMNADRARAEQEQRSARAELAALRARVAELERKKNTEHATEVGVGGGTTGKDPRPLPHFTSAAKRDGTSVLWSLAVLQHDWIAFCAALPEIAPRFVRVKLPGWRHEMYSCKDMGEVQQMMRNDCIAALRVQGVEVDDE